MLKVNKEREKFLIEAMGYKFNHHTDKYIWTNSGMWDEWQYFGRLWEFANTQRWWGEFVRDVIGEDSGILGPLYFPISQMFIDADALAQQIWMFIKKKEGMK